MYMVEKKEQYLSHLARFQCVNAADGPVWRVFVQQTGQVEPLYFPDLEHYFKFVVGETETAVVASSTPSNV